MAGKRSIIIFWALFLVPTLIVAGWAFRLLSHEQDRIRKSAEAALASRAQTASETIHLTIEDVRQNLAASLLEINQSGLVRQLLQWERTNPLVRNIFVYNPDQELEYPLPGMASTKEEQRFIKRYDALFSGRLAFDYNRNDLTEKPRGRTGSDKKFQTGRYDDLEISASDSSRKKLVALSRMKQAPGSLDTEKKTGTVSSPDSKAMSAADGFAEKSGWIPWFSENQLFILGWVQKREHGPVYGIELELVVLLSRLVSDFPRLEQENAALVIMDGNGNFMHQSGTLEVKTGQAPLASIHISPLLPHWRMAVFTDGGGLISTKGFLYLSVLLLGIFICAIISGGGLLTRITLRNIEDARQKTSFVSSVSHELKTPLTSIRMYAELLLSGRVRDEEKTRSYLSVMVDESRRLTRLINNVLDFGRLEQGRKKYQYTSFDLARFLAQMIHAHGIRIEKQGIKIITEIEPGETTICSDRDALEQVVLNLLDNALKYAGNGRFIKFILKKEQEYVLLKICDDGPGIAKKQQEMIFEKFYRADDSLTAEQQGSGLGLSISRQILRDMGGDLTFEPMPGNGSCFTARIKYHDAD